MKMNCIWTMVLNRKDHGWRNAALLRTWRFAKDGMRPTMPTARLDMNSLELESEMLRGSA